MNNETEIINFQKKQIVAVSKEAAKDAAPFKVIGDATQAYKAFAKKSPNATDAVVREFFLDYLKKKVKLAAGVGYIVTLESASVNTRERPYKVANVKNVGKRKWRTTREIIEKSTDKVLATVETTKADAINTAKTLFKEGKAQSTLFIKAVKSTENCIEATIEYVPSKGSHDGKYLVFGVVAD